MGMKSEAIDLTIAAAGSKVTYAGAGVGGLGWLFSSEFVGVIGVLIALAGVCVNWYYKRKASLRMEKESQLKQEETKVRIDLMRRSGQIIPDTSCPTLEPQE